LIGLNAAAAPLPRLVCMDAWIDIARWLVAAVGTVIVVGALLAGTLAWFLNHPD
jgi:hypothetical protein